MIDLDPSAVIVALVSERDSPPILPALALGWAALCRAMGRPSLTAHDVIARLYPADARAREPELDDLRRAIERLAPPARHGDPPDGRVLGEALRRRVSLAVIGIAPDAPLVRLVRAGKSGGRTRWRVALVSDR